METRDFSNIYLNARLIDIITYDKVLMDIDYPDKTEIKECLLFKVSKSSPEEAHIEYFKKYIKEIININNFYKIKILNERRQRNNIKNQELIILFSLDIKVNYNDQVLRHAKEIEDRKKITNIFKIIRSRQQ